MAKKILDTLTIIVSYKEDQRIEQVWEKIPKEEQLNISDILTDRFMETAGYARKDC